MRLTITLALLVLGLNLIAQKDEIILTVDGKSVTKSEFIEVYLKNNDNPDYSKKALEEYMELYKKFKLIVTEAENIQLDTTKSLFMEYKGYETQLARQYLTDNNATDALVKEAYEHMLEEVRASHILIQVKSDASPEDTLKAFKKISELRDRIMSNKSIESFEKACFGESEDPSAKQNKGDLGFFGAFQMVYPFENAAFDTKVGEISMPIRTDYGYHILYITDRRKARGLIECDHIMLINKKDQANDDNEKMIQEIYTRLEQGLDFKAAIMKYSQDNQSKKKGGVLPEFGTGSTVRMVPEFENQAFALTEDGAYSKPFKTSYGWHIVRRLKHTPVKPYEDLERELKLKVSKDSRSEITKKAFMNRLIKEYKLKDYSSKNLQIFFDSVTTDIFKAEFKGFKLEKDLVLYKYKGQDKPFMQSDFLEKLISSQSRKDEQDLKKFIETKYSRILESDLKNHEKSQLPGKYPKYKALLKEYKEGILLFELKNRNVWKKAIEDTTGLKAFFEKNKSDYNWPERIEAEVFECFNQTALEKVQSLLTTDLSAEAIRDSVNVKTNLNVRVNSGKYVVESNDILKGNTFKSGINKAYEKDGKYVVVKVIQTIAPGPKQLNECRGQVIAAYQEELEKNWMKELEDKYEVIIDKDVLHSLSK